MEMFGADAARRADNYTAIIEFRFDDIDEEYEKVKSLVTEVVQEPTTMPWGNYPPNDPAIRSPRRAQTQALAGRLQMFD
jgi:hypothetical protein